MSQYIIKFILSALIIVLASEVSKRNTVLAALIIALPLVSLITFSWIYYETKDTERIASLSLEILYFGLATVPMFLLLPYMLRNGYPFLITMLCCCGITALAMAVVKLIFLKS
ncbi:MAG: DUF3147 family protein [Thermodesulfobacteriota bacterium]|nr:MAG: DUF3147 family protein [Candidatus Dadabacteria bacterium]